MIQKKKKCIFIEQKVVRNKGGEVFSLIAYIIVRSVK